MKAIQFSRWMAQLSSLNPEQRDQLRSKLSPASEHPQDAIKAPSHCPHCQSKELRPWGSSGDLPRYRCKSCRRTFNALTKTPLARLRKKDKWFEQSKAMIEGTSISKTAERCGVDYKTSFRWRHRFLGAPCLDKPKTLSGIVESDEMFILESYKGKRSEMPRPSRKRGGKATKRGVSSEQIPVIVARDRAGATVGGRLPQAPGAARVLPRAESGTLLCEAVGRSRAGPGRSGARPAARRRRGRRTGFRC